MQLAGIAMVILGGALMLLYSGALRRPLNAKAGTAGAVLVAAGAALQLWSLYA